jgi:hypothetical protein
LIEKKESFALFVIPFFKKNERLGLEREEGFKGFIPLTPCKGGNK